MKKFSPLCFIKLFAILFFSLSQTSQALEVEFNILGEDPDNRGELIDCHYTSVLKTREARLPQDPPIHTFELSPQTAKTPSRHKRCEEIYSNLTNLEQQKVRDDIGKTLSQMTCKPDAKVLITAGLTQNNDAPKRFPNIRSNWVLNAIQIDGCLGESRSDTPNSCWIPCKRCDSGSRAIIDYNEMMILFKRCASETDKIIADEKLLDKWAKDNDPNATRGQQNHLRE
jgi:hypothetical protein